MVLAPSKERGESIARCLSPALDLAGLLISGRRLDTVRERQDLERTLAEIAGSSATTLVIDAAWGGNEDVWKRLSMERLVGLRGALRSEPLPAGLSVISALRAREVQEGGYRLIVFLLETPSVALTQEILRLGADWVWPHSSAAKVAELLPKLRSTIEGEAHGTSERPLILVVENSRNTCQRLEAELEPYCELDFAGSQKRGDSFDISPEEAISAFGERAYRLVIVDMALSEESEAAARDRFLAGENRELETFYEAQGEEGRHLLRRVWGGLEVIRRIRQISSSVPIIAFSLYLADTIPVNMLKLFLGSKVSRTVTVVAKSEESMEELREIVLSELGEKGSGREAGNGN